MKVALVIGTRPQIIKSAPIIHAALEGSELDIQVVHTGQHYDYEMSRIFFSELDLPDLIVNLGVGSGSHAARARVLSWSHYVKNMQQIYEELSDMRFRRTILCEVFEFE